VQDSRQHQL